VCTLSGYQVVMVDVNRAISTSLSNHAQRREAARQRAHHRGTASRRQREPPDQHQTDAVSRADVVIEAASENARLDLSPS
jgi:3-hydroxyacyl-CoA dehydrogenase